MLVQVDGPSCKDNKFEMPMKLCEFEWVSSAMTGTIWHYKTVYSAHSTMGGITTFEETAATSPVFRRHHGG